MPSRAKNPVHKLQKSKYTYTVALPIEYVRELGWIENQKVIIKKTGNKLVIEDWPASVRSKKTVKKNNKTTAGKAK